MFLSLHGHPSEQDGFLFVLAEKLGKTCAEIRSLPMSEIVAWRSYLTVKHSAEDLARRAAAHG